MKCTDLKKKAITLLKSNRGKWPVIAQDTGLDYNWIAKMASGAIADPGVSKIEKLLSWKPKNQ